MPDEETTFRRRHLAQLRSELESHPEDEDADEASEEAGAAAAPAAGAAPPPGDARARILRSFSRPSGSQVLGAVLVGLLTFAGVTQVRLYGESDTYAGLRQSDLVQALSGLQAAQTKADDEISRLTKTRDRLRNSSDKGTTALEQATRELNTLGILAGTLPAVGPGIRIVVTDTRGQYRVNHLLDGIEELRDAGAEAISINRKVRVVAQTSFADGEGGIEVDGQLLTAPYTLDVIGDPDTLSRALDFPGGFKDDVALDQGTTKVTKLAKVRIDAIRTPSKPTYAQPDS
ncbi:MAG TPA: DUF881 domain-containing protein [Marmoricola sp.]